MKALYLTADRIGLETGGGLVTAHELRALREFAGAENVEVWDREVLQQGVPNWGVLTVEEPWVWDEIALGKAFTQLKEKPALCHIYAGTFTRTTLQAMKQNGVKVTYTAAAHDVEKSRRAHVELGLPYDLPHLNDPDQFRRYLGGYANADSLVCPSTHSEAVMRGFGCKNRITRIPHGVTLPEKLHPLPRAFTVGYLGSYGADKGVRYLLEAWKTLDYPDATLLLGGRDSTSPWVRHLIDTYGGGNIHCTGWVHNVSDFYSRCSLYVQPSVTEGFGIEVLEAMAHGRAVICSRGAGAVDVVPPVAGVCLEETESSIRYQIDWFRSSENGKMWLGPGNTVWREEAEKHTWEKIRYKYRCLWDEVLQK